MAVAALDVGKRRIGIAVSSLDGLIVSALGTIDRRSVGHDIDSIRAGLAGRDVQRVIIGLPLNMDGTEGPQARYIRRFADQLREETGLIVEMYDERLTSFEARERMRGTVMRRARRWREVDAVAACLILEGWLESQRGAARSLTPSPGRSQ